MTEKSSTVQEEQPFDILWVFKQPDYVEKWHKGDPRKDPPRPPIVGPDISIRYVDTAVEAFKKVSAGLVNLAVVTNPWAGQAKCQKDAQQFSDHEITLGIELAEAIVTHHPEVPVIVYGSVLHSRLATKLAKIPRVTLLPYTAPTPDQLAQAISQAVANVQQS